MSHIPLVLLITLMAMVLITTYSIFYGCTQTQYGNQGSDNNQGGGNNQTDQEIEIVDPSLPETLLVKISGFSFNQPTNTITTNSIVKWTNEDGVTHTITSGIRGSTDAGSKFDILISSGQVKSIRFKKSGTYDYFCKPHTSMSNKINVTQ